MVRLRGEEGGRGATYYHKLSEGSTTQIQIWEGGGWLAGWLAAARVRSQKTIISTGICAGN